MLNTIEFKATIKDGVIKIPEEFQKDLSSEKEYQVILQTAINSAPHQTTRPKDIIDELTKNPISVDGFLSREDIYDL